MKITTKGRYGLRAMVELARNYTQREYQSLRSISQNQNIPENYLERLLAKLRKAELIETHRGTQGGYRLLKEPAELSVLEILMAVEEPLYLVECTENAEVCPQHDQCPSNVVWSKMAKEMKRVARETTLNELL
jgi:Rrf2 family protein